PLCVVAHEAAIGIAMGFSLGKLGPLRGLELILQGGEPQDVGNKRFWAVAEIDGPGLAPELSAAIDSAPAHIAGRSRNETVRSAQGRHFIFAGERVRREAKQGKSKQGATHDDPLDSRTLSPRFAQPD